MRSAVMKVLITVPRLDLPGGVANYYRALRRWLDERKVYFEVGFRAGETGLASAMVRFMADSWRFHRALRRESFDLVHINPSMGMRSVLRDGLLLLVAVVHGVPVLVFFRGWDGPCAARINQRYRRLFQAVYGKAAAFVVLGTEFRSALVELGITAPIFLETTVVDAALLRAVDDASASRPRAAKGACQILYLSRLEPDKGLPEAIDAFAELQREWPANSSPRHPAGRDAGR